MSPQETSSLLKRLSDAHYLRASQHPQDKRSRLYTIREGFFDIWLAMNLSRGARKRLPFLLEFFNLFYPNIDAREEKRRLLREKLIEEGSVNAEKTLDYLSEVGDENERATAKFDMARIFARRGDAEQMASYVREAAPLAGDGVSQSIARIITSNRSAPDYLAEVEEMIACWEMHRSGEFENFANRLIEMGEGLTLRMFSETRLDFLCDTLESIDDSAKRILQRLKIATELMALARWDESETQQRKALAEAKEHANAKLVVKASNNLAQLLKDTNRIGEAEPLMRRALEINEASFGEHHPTVATSLNNLATLLQDTNRMGEAEPLMRRALEISKASFGEHHPTVAIGLNNLATLLKHTNRIGEAEPLMRRALEIEQGLLRRAPPDRGDKFEQPGAAAEAHQPDRGGGAADAASAGDRRGLLRRAPPGRGNKFEQPGATAAGHQPDGGGGTTDAASVGDQQGVLRRAPPDRGDSFEQLGAAAAGHQPDGGGGAADAASAGDRRGLLRRAPPDRGDSI